MNIGHKIKKARKDKGLTQAELGEKIGKSTITIRKYESGDIFPPLATLSEISQSLELPIEYFLLDTEKVTEMNIDYIIKLINNLSYKYDSLKNVSFDYNELSEIEEYVCRQLLIKILEVKNIDFGLSLQINNSKTGNNTFKQISD